MTHLLVTNDFPPKLGGIQSYLWELWRRFPPGTFRVLTAAHPGSRRFDEAQPFEIERTRERVLLPTRSLVRQIERAAGECGAGLVVLDPALPLGLVGRHLDRPYAVVVHGAEVSVPGRLPIARARLRNVLTGAGLVVAAGGYSEDEARRVAGTDTPPVVVVPPGVDHERFRQLGDDERRLARESFGLPADTPLVVSVSRLVPRKGMDVLIEAVSMLARSHPDVALLIAGGGREHRRLDKAARSSRASVRLLGKVPDSRLPSLYGCADVFAMICRNRWRGLEQEGFGIVFLEAAACGVPQVAGDSGGAAEAVAEGETGLVVRSPCDPVAVAAALARLLDDADLRMAMGVEARRRAVDRFDYAGLAAGLAAALAESGG